MKWGKTYWENADGQQVYVYEKFASLAKTFKKFLLQN